MIDKLKLHYIMLRLSYIFNKKIFYFFLSPNETWMNSFLFNILVIMICSCSLNHFCTFAFAEYSRLSDLNMIYNV